MVSAKANVVPFETYSFRDVCLQSVFRGVDDDYGLLGKTEVGRWDGVDGTWGSTLTETIVFVHETNAT